MNIKKLYSGNTALKVTSLNAMVITVRLIISVFIQRLLAVCVGEYGIANIGQIRNVMAMLSSTSSLGTFNGIIKYVAEYKKNQSELTKLFSTLSIFISIGSLVSAAVLFFSASYLSIYLFNSEHFVYVFQLLAVIVPFIAINRVVNAVVSGVSDYKRYAKIELISYILAAVALVIGLYTSELKGVIIAIALAPLIQLAVLALIFGKTLSTYLKLKSIGFNLYYKNRLLAFTLMSFISTFLLNFVELKIRTLITDEISINEAGYWTAVTFISKNYMVFASGLFTLYVLPKFASIYAKEEFKKEVFHIYKTILPIFGVGMFLVYLFRHQIIQIVYPNFLGMAPLFKWQLLGDFIKLCALVLGYQFIAKRLVKSFVVTEIISLVLFFILSKIFIIKYGTEGVVIAHLVRYAIYFLVVFFFIRTYYNRKSLSKK